MDQDGYMGKAPSRTMLASNHNENFEAALVQANGPQTLTATANPRLVEAFLSNMSRANWNTLFVIDATLAISSAVCAGVNLGYVIKGKRAPDGWLAGGLTTGILTTLAGLPWLGLWGILKLLDEHPPPYLMQLGLGHLILGTVDIVFTTLAFRGSERTDIGELQERVSIVPILFPGVTGQPAFGAVLQLTGW